MLRRDFARDIALGRIEAGTNQHGRLEPPYERRITRAGPSTGQAGYGALGPRGRDARPADIVDRDASLCLPPSRPIVLARALGTSSGTVSEHPPQADRWPVDRWIAIRRDAKTRRGTSSRFFQRHYAMPYSLKRSGQSELGLLPLPRPTESPRRRRRASKPFNRRTTRPQYRL